MSEKMPLSLWPEDPLVIPEALILRHIYMNGDGVSKVRVAIVTARNAPAHARVIHTLRAWGTAADEAHFVGARTKAPILKAFGAHIIFFDDQEKHVLGASSVVPSGHVPGPHSPDEPVIPCGIIFFATKLDREQWRVLAPSALL